MINVYGDMEKSISKVVWHLEEPRVGQSYPNYYISSLVCKFVKVILSGIGGDELFGGYSKYTSYKWKQLMILLPNKLKNILISYGRS